MKFKSYILLGLFAFILFIPVKTARAQELKYIPKPQYAKAKVLEVKTFD